MTPDSLIDALGGTSEVARELTVAAPVVSNWRFRGKIPSTRWVQIAAIAARRKVGGITVDAIASMHRRSDVPARRLVGARR